jgi:penicillin-binding protein 1A
VLAQMVRHGRLSQKAYDGLRGRPLGLDFERQDLENNRAPHFTEAVRRWAIDWAEVLGLNVYADGLTIRTTLDPRLQQMAAAAVTRQLDALQVVADVEWGRASDRLLSTQAAAYRQARAKTEPFAHFWKSRAELVATFIRESPEFAAQTAAGVAPDAALAKLRTDAAFMQSLRERKTRLEAGFVALDPRSGHVRAWVGSRDHAIDRYDHVQQARRQPGSTFKPFVYGAALEAGVDAWQEYPDRPVTVRLPNGEIWRPRDMRASTGENVSLEDGLVHSRNAVTVQVMAQVGPKRVADFAQRLGVRDSRLDAVPSLALGTSPVSLLEMASAYGTIAALGSRRPPVMVTRVTARDGAVLFDQTGESAPPAEQVLDGDVAVTLIDMLRGAIERGTGRGIRDAFGIGADVAGKTGTTQNNTDGWFVLMHPELVAGAWVGFNDARVTLRSNHWGQGAHNALPVVGDFMRAAIAQRAVDAGAAFPTRASPVAMALRRFGDRLRSWLGLDSAPRQ